MSMIRTKKTAIPISRTNREVALNPKETVDFATMRHSMEQELENRRLQWEQEVARMQQDFFQLKPEDLDPQPKRDVSVDVVPRESIPERFPIRPPGSEIIDINNSDTLYTQLEDGRKVYRLRFDVRGFEPGDIHVKMEGDKLAVSASHEDDIGLGRKSCRQFNRKMDLPDDVDGDTLQAHLSTDGILLVEADLDPSKVEDAPKTAPPALSAPAVQTIQDLAKMQPAVQVETTRSAFHAPAHTNHHPVTFPPSFQLDGSSSAFKAITPSNNRGMFSRFSSPLVVITDGQRKLKLVVNIGQGYDVDDVVVKYKNDKIGVYASQEKTEPRPSKREFSREFELPETIEASTIIAMLTPDGQVMIGASIHGNTDHQTVIRSIKADVPPDAKKCKLEI